MINKINKLTGPQFMLDMVKNNMTEFISKSNEQFKKTKDESLEIINNNGMYNKVREDCKNKSLN